MRDVILVTGGAGYVGSQLVPALLTLGYPVRVVDTLWFDYRLPEHLSLEIISGDLRSPDKHWLNNVGAIINLAGLSNDPTADFAPSLNAECNVSATWQLAEMAAQLRRPLRFIQASSCSIYYTAQPDGAQGLRGKSEADTVSPTANYSKTKRLAEIDLLSLAGSYPMLCPVILRKGTLFGLAPRMRFDLVINAFVLSAWSQQSLTVYGSGEAWRPLLHIRDAVDAYTYALRWPETSVRGQIFNVLHKNYRVLELAFWVAEVLRKHRDVTIRIERDRTQASGERSYNVRGNKLERCLGFRAERGTEQAICEIWDALSAGAFGPDPKTDPRFYNLRWLSAKKEFK